jgi:hypothetical protein
VLDYQGMVILNCYMSTDFTPPYEPIEQGQVWLATFKDGSPNFTAAGKIIQPTLYNIFSLSGNSTCEYNRMVIVWIKLFLRKVRVVTILMTLYYLD